MQNDHRQRNLTCRCSIVLAVLALGVLVQCRSASEAPPSSEPDSARLVVEHFPSTRAKDSGVHEWNLGTVTTGGVAYVVGHGYALTGGARTAVLEVVARVDAVEDSFVRDPASGGAIALSGVRRQAVADDFNAMSAALRAIRHDDGAAGTRSKSIQVRAEPVACDGADAGASLVSRCPTQLLDCATALTGCGEDSNRAANTAGAVGQALSGTVASSASSPPASATLGAGGPPVDRSCVAAADVATSPVPFAEALDALRRNDDAAFERALSRTTDPDQEDSLGLTLAMHAAALGRTRAIEALAQRNADVLRSNRRTGATILHVAAQAATGSVEVVRLVRSRMGDARFVSTLNTRIGSNNHTVAMEAVFNVNELLVRELLRLRAELPDIDFATTAVTGWGPQTFAFRERYSFAGELPPSAVTAPELADFLANRGTSTRDEVLARINEARTRWSAEQDAAFLRAASDSERANQTAGQALLDSIAAARAGTLPLTELESRVNANRSLVNATFGRMGATLLSAVPAPGLSAEQLGRAERIQEILIRAGADPNLAETGLMLVPAGFRESVFGYHTMVQRYVENLCGDQQRARFLDIQGPLNGYTKLIDAALRGRRDVICVLLASNADRSVAALNGMTARDAAERFNQTTTDPASRLPSSILDALAPSSTAQCPQ